MEIKETVEYKEWMDALENYRHVAAKIILNSIEAQKKFAEASNGLQEIIADLEKRKLEIIEF